MKRTTLIAPGLAVLALAMLTALTALPNAQASLDDEPVAVKITVEGPHKRIIEAGLVESLKERDDVKAVRSAEDADAMLHITTGRQQLKVEGQQSKVMASSLVVTIDGEVAFHYTEFIGASEHGLKGVGDYGLTRAKQATSR